MKGMVILSEDLKGSLELVREQQIKAARCIVHLRKRILDCRHYVQDIYMSNGDEDVVLVSGEEASRIHTRARDGCGEPGRGA
jgi:hypothetical protein